VTRVVDAEARELRILQGSLEALRNVIAVEVRIRLQWEEPLRLAPSLFHRSGAKRGNVAGVNDHSKTDIS